MTSNIMSLGGIAIAVGAMVDAAIVMIENAHKHLERLKPGQSRAEALIEAAVEVGPSLFFGLLIITVSFLPVFTLESQEGRLFKPLAFTKTFSMAGAAILSVTLVPVLMMLFIRGRILPGAQEPDQPLPDLGLPAADQRRTQSQDADHPARASRCWGPRGTRSRGSARSSCRPSTRAPSSTCRRRCPASRSPRRLGVAAGPGQDHQELPRGRLGVRQGRTRRDRDRSRRRPRCSRP